MLIIKTTKLRRLISPKFYTPALAGLLMLSSPESLGRGVELHISMQPVRELQTSFAVPDITLRVLSPTVYQVAATSELSQGETILETATLTEGYKLDPELLRKTAGVIEFRAPHEYMKEGVYAQQINITIWNSELDIPVVEPQFRYFRATVKGVLPISAEEYSRVVEPAQTFVDQSGRKTFEYSGSRLGRKLNLDGKLGFDRQETAERISDVRDYSEKNEP